MEILVVDDNILDRKYLKHLIENNISVSVCTAKDGEDALRKIKHQYFDLVITDIVMPKMEGIELMEHIKSISPSTEVIAVSGHNPYYLYIAKKMGIKGIFTKPVDTNKFLDRIKTISYPKLRVAL